MDRSVKKTLFMIILLGTVLRLWGIDFGLPYQFHQDEPIIVNHALAYGTGDFNPHFFIIPPLTSYILFFFYGIYFVFLNVAGMVKGSDLFAMSFFKDPTPFYLIGRIAIGMISGVINVFLTYRLAIKFVSERAAIFASLAMAVAFLNVINSHYIYTDNLLVTFTLLAYIVMAELIIHPKNAYYILAAALIGAAIATKYNAALLVAPFFIAHMIATKKNIIKAFFDLKLFIFIGVIAISFIACNPYSLIDWKLFLLSVTGRIRQGYMGWAHHIAYSLFEGVGVIVTVGGFTGLCLMLIKDVKKSVFLISFPILFYLHLVYRSQPFSRYTLLLIPFLSIGAGYLLYDIIFTRMRSRAARIAAIIVSLAVLLPTTIKSVKADLLFTREDTRSQAAAWIKDNVPAGTKIALDNMFFAPQIRQTAEQLKEKEAIINKQPELALLKTKKLDYQIKALQGEKTYETYYIIQGDENIGQFLKFWPIVKNDIDALKRKGIEYVIINNMITAKGMRSFDNEMIALYKPIAQFSPYGNSSFRGSYDEIETTCIPILDKELFSRQRFGPYILIYKIK